MSTQATPTSDADTGTGAGLRPRETRPADTRQGRRSMTLGEAWREFTRWPSPRFFAVALPVVALARGLAGGFSLGDLWVVAAMLAAWPFAEWATHIVLLHMKPKDVLRGKMTLDPLFARKHREHHAEPTETELVFLPMVVLFTLLPVFAAIGLFAFPSTALGLTFLLTITVIGAGYEWTHYLVHTDYRPKTAPYRALWRHHRLHHYKNENYWFGLTSTTADHALRTAPEPGEVERSATARDLLGTSAEP